MNTCFTFAGRELQLYRYPEKSQHPTLQAWGSEDEYVLTHLIEEKVSLGRTLVLNDEFGALACGLNPLVDGESVWQSDSYISHCALKDNLQRNTMQSQFEIVDSLHINTGYFDTVIMRIPKNTQYLSYQLEQLRHCVRPDTRVIATGKVKAVTNQLLTLLEKALGTTKTSLAVKKSRLIFCTPSAELLADSPSQMPFVSWKTEASKALPAIAVDNLPNVFSSRSLDIGARFMLQNLMPFNNETVLDLGCGNGVLGIAAMTLSESCSVTFVDESFMAVESARRNVIHNLPNRIDCAHFIVDNCLDKHKQSHSLGPYDRILCNPPFHQQNTLTDHIAWQMFNDAKAHLKKGGKLWVVGNRHLGYHDKLKRVFGGAKTLASNPKFVILEAVKR